MFITDKLVGLVAPHKCVQCTAEGSLLCENCIQSAPYHPGICYNCHRLSADFYTCTLCVKQSELKQVIIAGLHENGIKEAIHSYKYNNAIAGAKPLANLVSLALRSNNLCPIDIVTWLPTASARKRKRGYDHSELLARECAKELKLPFVKTLTRIGSTKQVGTDRRTRLAQLQNAFYPISSKSLANKRVLLIDDVITTGASLNSAAKAIKSSGAIYVCAAVISRKAT